MLTDGKRDGLPDVEDAKTEDNSMAHNLQEGNCPLTKQPDREKSDQKKCAEDRDACPTSRDLRNWERDSCFRRPWTERTPRYWGRAWTWRQDGWLPPAWRDWDQLMGHTWADYDGERYAERTRDRWNEEDCDEADCGGRRCQRPCRRRRDGFGSQWPLSWVVYSSSGGGGGGVGGGGLTMGNGTV